MPEGTDIAVQSEQVAEAEGRVRKNESLYAAAKSVQDSWSDKATESLEFYHGDHWTPKQRATLLERGQMPVEIQITYQTVEQAVGMLTANNPQFRATAREDSDRRVAAMWSDILQWIFDKSEGNRQYRDIARNTYVMGRGCAVVYPDWNADFGRGEVKFRSVDPRNVFPDPRSSDPMWDDASFIITRNLFTPFQVAQLWGEAVATDVVDRGSPSSGSYTFGRTRANDNGFPIHQSDIQFEAGEAGDLYEIIERYEKVKRPYFRVTDALTGEDEILSKDDLEERKKSPAYVRSTQFGENIVIDPAAVAELDEQFNSFGPVFHQIRQSPSVDDAGQLLQSPPVTIPGPAGPNAVPGSEVRLTPTSVGALIDNGLIPVIPFQMDRIMVYISSGGVEMTEPFELPLEHYPVVPFGFGSSGTPYPKSDVMRIRPLQEVINKTQSLIMAHLANSTNMKVFVPEGQFSDVADLEDRWSKAGYTVIEYDPLAAAAAPGGGGQMGGIVVVSPPPLPAALYTSQRDSIALIERITGLYAIQQGEPGNAPETFRGTLAMDDFGQRRMKHKLESLEDSLSRLGTVMVQWAQKVYTREKVIRITTPTGATKESSLNVFQLNDYTGEAETVNDITKGHYDVKIVSGSTLPSNRWARLQTYLEMRREGIVDDIAVLQASEIPDAEEIAQRVSVLSQAQQAIESHEKTISDLEGDLQTLQREVLHSERQVEVQKFKSQLSRILAETNAAASVARKNVSELVVDARREEKQRRTTAGSEQKTQTQAA